MKFLITESKLKEFIINKSGIDLTNKIEVVNSYEDLTREFKKIIPQSILNFYIKKYGNMFILDLDSDEFLIQFQKEENGDKFTMIVNKNDRNLSESKLLEILNMDNFGIPLEDIVEIFLREFKLT